MAHRSHLDQLFLEHDGLLSFERFMEEALYHPRFGYYSSNIATVGRRGDFSTSPTLHDVLARGVAKWATQEKKSALDAGIGRRWHVIEIGAGDGSFARDFFKHVASIHRPFLTYHIVEKSDPLTKRQRETIPWRHRVKWHPDMISALNACGGKALIVSNELVDAFPATVLQWNASQRAWQELYLRDLGHDGIAEEFLPLGEHRSSRSSTLFTEWDAEEIPKEHGQRGEVHWAFQDWVHEWLPHLERGSMVTIDYGDIFPRLYKKRPKGTMRGYFQGVRVQSMEIYDRFGHQDLTADVNFSDLMAWMEEAGFVTVDLLPQRAFLTKMVPSLSNVALQQQDAALEFVMSPYGAGDAFKVLWQRYGS